MPNFSSLAARLPWPADCVLCLAPACDGALCAGCSASLERVECCCPRCALPLAAPGGRCGACRTTSFAFDSAAACYAYGFPLDRLVQRFKYAGDLALGRWLGAVLARRVEGEPRPDVIVVPPLSAARLRERGFNQALELARVVGRRTGVRVAAQALARQRETAAQAALGRRERLTNARGAFRCEMALDGLQVAIVDDVLTTGATADGIARALKAAGAASVSVWAVARAPDPAGAP